MDYRGGLKMPQAYRILSPLPQKAANHHFFSLNLGAELQLAEKKFTAANP
jgi:hypothetical protein